MAAGTRRRRPLRGRARDLAHAAGRVPCLPWLVGGPEGRLHPRADRRRALLALQAPGQPPGVAVDRPRPDRRSVHLRVDDELRVVRSRKRVGDPDLRDDIGRHRCLPQRAYRGSGRVAGPLPGRRHRRRLLDRRARRPGSHTRILALRLPHGVSVERPGDLVASLVVEPSVRRRRSPRSGSSTCHRRSSHLAVRHRDGTAPPGNGGRRSDRALLPPHAGDVPDARLPVSRLLAGPAADEERGAVDDRGRPLGGLVRVPVRPDRGGAVRRSCAPHAGQRCAPTSIPCRPRGNVARAARRPGAASRVPPTLGRRLGRRERSSPRAGEGPEAVGVPARREPRGGDRPRRAAVRGSGTARDGRRDRALGARERRAGGGPARCAPRARGIAGPHRECERP